MRLLAVDQVDANHGLFRAVKDVSFSVMKGETIALIGANGAGKTTLLRTLAGAHRSSAGVIKFGGIDVTAMPAHARVKIGMALVPEGRRLFLKMTVQENLLLACSAGRLGDWNVESVLEALPQLKKRIHARTANLSGGEQQAVAIGRALMTNPDLLLLDEVSLGLSPIAVEGVYHSLKTLIAGGTTCIIVEQDLNRALKIADRFLCMLEGRIVLRGDCEEFSREQITQAYFGLVESESEKGK
jgi:branched-chain amino acid transport system ATP-binding protein